MRKKYPAVIISENNKNKKPKKRPGTLVNALIH